MIWIFRQKAYLRLRLILLACIISSTFAACKKATNQFSNIEVEEAKQFVVNTIIPLYPGQRSRERVQNGCELYEKILARLDASDVSGLLKWHPPVIEFQSYTYFIFFVPRSSPEIELCTDNCLGTKDIPVTVLRYEISEAGKANWEEYEMVLHSGKWVYRPKNPCELLQRKHSDNKLPNNSGAAD